MSLKFGIQSCRDYIDNEKGVWKVVAFLISTLAIIGTVVGKSILYAGCNACFSYLISTTLLPAIANTYPPFVWAYDLSKQTLEWWFLVYCVIYAIFITIQIFKQFHSVFKE